MKFQQLNKLLNNTNIQLLSIREHSKASEVYLDVLFNYPQEYDKWEGAIPIVYRRIGLSLNDPSQVSQHIKSAYKLLTPRNRERWKSEQLKIWEEEHKGKTVTKPIFESLCNFRWNCRHCGVQNPNWARRYQDIKEMGYLTSTAQRECQNCRKKTSHDLLVPFIIGPATGYEVISPTLKLKIIKTLHGQNSYEAKKTSPKSLIPDHKFPEIRWDKDTKEKNNDQMTTEEIKSKFQLLDNQRNQQKREVCRLCYQSGKRGIVYGIKYYYRGNENWPQEVPQTGKKAEAGCKGCGWYDLQEWRKSLNEKLSLIST